MKTSQSITFVSRDGAGTTPLRVLRLFQVEDPDNLNAVQIFERDYFEENGESPTYVTREEVTAHAARLDEALTQSFSQTIRLYGYNQATDEVIRVVQGSGVFGAEHSETLTESITVNGSTQLSTLYPITSVSNSNLNLLTEDGTPYTGSFTVDDAGVIQLGQICYGYASITYVHEWIEIEVTGLDTTARDKRNALLLVTSGTGNDSIDVTFPDVEDAESSIAPDDETFIRIWAHRNKNNRATRDPLSVREFYEVTRSIGTVEVDGVTIERARSVTMQEGEGGQNIRFTFDIPPVETGG
ncbi:hypothetical protein [Vibrio phage D4]|nr:hypothetical protein vBVcaS_HC034 [Vibrio phage vB_VcaS_HC]UHD87330.1 hypothetical protein [Vibrio phage D4]